MTGKKSKGIGLKCPWCKVPMRACKTPRLVNRWWHYVECGACCHRGPARKTEKGAVSAYERVMPGGGK